MSPRLTLTCLFTLVLLPACSGGSLSETGGPRYTDADDDGVFAIDDCDDEDATVSPEAPEVCDGKDNDCDVDVDEDATDATAWYTDADRDGVGTDANPVYACEVLGGTVDVGGDCDDANDAVYPGADELCNGVDDDCDGETDPDSSLDAPMWYPDADGDGFGQEDATPVVACAPPDGYGADATDCDDADAAISPDGVEVCDEVDNDCDGRIDPGTAEDAATWYEDSDGDGYGDADSSRVLCTAPDGYVADATDCDDDSDAVSPGAPETCDGEDNDCDGVRDPPTSVDAPTWYFDADGDGFGDPAGTVTVCTGPAGYIADGTDCDDSDARRNPGGWPCTTDVRTTDASATRAGITPSDSAGFSLWGGDDYNSDGTADFAVGAYKRSSGKGAAYVLFGALSGSASLSASSLTLSDSTLTGVGIWTGSAGDLDGDGEADLGLLASKGGFYGLLAPVSTGDSLSGYDVRLTAEVSADSLTGAAGGFDLNGDGADDVAVADPHWPGSGDTGAVYVAFGAFSGSSALSSADLILRGAASGDAAGGDNGLARGGDLDGDGIDDLLIGAKGNDGGGSAAGALYVVSGGSAGTLSLSDADAVVLGSAAGQYVGEAVAGGGDADGDGYGDLLVGSSAYSSGTGAAWLFSGPLAGAGTLADATASLPGAASSDSVGGSLGELRDLDGDGLGDLVIGATLDFTCGKKAGNGSVYVLYGPQSGTLSCEQSDAVLAGDSYGTGFSKGLASVGDVDGDGLGDLFVGAYLESGGYAFLFPGSAF